MQRNIDINEISDGKKYTSSDLVKIGCNDCEGCYECCQNMQGLITLDPYDIHRMTKDSDTNTFETMMNKRIEFTVDRNVLVPVLKMDEQSGKCTFLSDSGRCSIHNTRPGICRLFPLGRLYEDGSFSYFLQKDECQYSNKTKIKIKNWLETSELAKYEKYISDWHYFIADIRDYMANSSEEEINQINTSLLQIFYIKPYEDSFYEDLYKRLLSVKELL